ncbi:MAG TPA: hypothetical protein VFJ16_24520 [Longimicrobium sp.]|nr:hypothetical protein [Longimicrobium sp.]
MAKAHTLVDNFNDDQLNTSAWAVTPSGSDRVREVNGRVEIQPPGNTVGIFAYVTPTAAYDLTDSEARVELLRVATAPGARTGLAAISSGGGYVIIWVFDGQVECTQTTAAGVTTSLRKVPYDPPAHRWLRLSERAGNTRWEVSPDGEAWTVLCQNANPVTLTAVQLEFGVSVTVSQPWPGTAVFDNFNVRNTSLARRVEERSLSARDVRVRAAGAAAARRHEEHANNNDEANYPGRPFIGNFSKGLGHDNLGDPDPITYGTLLRAWRAATRPTSRRSSWAPSPPRPRG